MRNEDVQTKPLLSEQQMTAINLLLTGMSQRDVCKVVRISPLTLERWKEDPAFRAEFDRVTLKGGKHMRKASTTEAQEDSAHEASVEMDTFIELIEGRLKLLSEKLLGPHTPQELHAEVTQLNDLLTSFRFRADMLAKLIDGATSQVKRDRIRSMLSAMSIRVHDNKEKLYELHDRSNELIKKSAALITRAQQKINRVAHLSAGYATKACGLCKGVESARGGRCPACEGKGSVLVREPATKCHRCAGDGTTRAADAAIHYSALCVECSGTGWLAARR